MQVVLNLPVSLVDDWRKALKWSSTKLHLLMFLINGVCMAMPTLDPSIAALIPAPFKSPVISMYAALAVMLRVTKFGAAQPPANVTAPAAP